MLNMMRKILPAVLQQVLEYHVNESQLTHDDDLQSIYDHLNNLNQSVELLKIKIKSNREKNKVCLIQNNLALHFDRTQVLRVLS